MSYIKDEIREDLRVQFKLLKRYFKKLEDQSIQIKKVEEFNQINKEMMEIDLSIQLLKTAIYLIRNT